jgi:hypothetical protein
MIRQADSMPPDQRRKFLDSLNRRPTPKRPAPPPYPRGRGTSPTDVKQFDDRRERSRDVAGIGDDINATGDAVASAVAQLGGDMVAALNRIGASVATARSQIINAKNV